MCSKYQKSLFFENNVLGVIGVISISGGDKINGRLCRKYSLTSNVDNVKTGNDGQEDETEYGNQWR